jgi:hypothetical protein
MVSGLEQFCVGAVIWVEKMYCGTEKNVSVRGVHLYQVVLAIVLMLYGT